MIELSDYEKHVAFDLATYTVNTRELYPYAQDIMRFRAKDEYSNKLWLGHAKLGRNFYQDELGDCDSAMFNPEVLQLAADMIKDHYQEEQESYYETP